MIERHQDYILQIASLAPGQSLTGTPLILDLDAPFVCRGVGMHMSPGPDRTQNDLWSCTFRLRNRTGRLLAQQPIQTPAGFWGAIGQNGIYRPVYPQQPYGAGEAIAIDFENLSSNTLYNLQFIFRGTKLFADGTLANPTYPDNARVLDFTYQTGKGTVPDPSLILATEQTLYQQIFQVKGDADFALRGLQAGNWTSSGDGGVYSTNGYTELYIQLMDAKLKPYSNLPIHIDWLAGNAGGSTLPGFTALGNAAPGLLMPEIYVPRSNVLFYNLYRNDAAYVSVTDALPVRLAMAWIGSKVYAQ
jgi:hypothetical protein